MPKNASSVENSANLSGFFLKIIQHKYGTKITFVPVRNAFLADVVYWIPIVCVAKAAYKNIPVTIPAAISFLVIFYLW